MPKVPSENYERIVTALGRLGFVVVRQRGSHIRLKSRLRMARSKSPFRRTDP